MKGARGIALDLYYNESCDHAHAETSPPEGSPEVSVERGLTITAAETADLFPWESFIRRAAKRIYDRKLLGGQIDLALWEQQALALWTGTKTGFGAVEYGTPNHGLLLQYKYNVHVFAAFKNHENTSAIASLLLDENGQPLSENKFIKEALGISKDYNKRHLITERLLAVRRARTGNFLMKALENIDLYPNWEYIKSKAADPREDHKKHYGKVFSLTTTEGRSILPPNGWKCQCGYRVTDKELTDEKPDTSDIKAEFLEDPTNGRIFSELHPYFEVQKEFEPWAKKNWNLDLPANSNKIKNIFKEWQRVTKSNDYVIEHKNKDTGGFVAIQKGFIGHELEENMKVAKLLADENADAVVLLKELPNQKNPDALINGKLSEFKKSTPDKSLKNNINNHFKEARRKNEGSATQLIDEVIIRLPEKVDFEILSNAAYRAFYNNEKASMKLERVIFIHKNKVLILDRKAYADKTIEHWIQKKLNN